MRMVFKFGGTSVAGPSEVRRAAGKIAEAYRAGHSVAAVLSAQGHTTDELLSRSEEYNRNPSPRELDMLLATGEQASVSLMAMTLGDMGLPAVSLTGWQAGIHTDSAPGRARIVRLSPDRVERELSAGRIVIVAGFQGISPEGDITTLGRGGSDTTAAALAAALGADVCRIYTDVDGVYSADPRLVPGAIRREEIDSEEMRLLAANGSQVLHEPSVILARDAALTLEVLSPADDTRSTRILPLPAPPEGRLTALTRDGGLLSLVGSGLDSMEALPQRAKSALAAGSIPMRSFLLTPRRLTVQTEEKDSLAALRLLHREFFEK